MKSGTFVKLLCGFLIGTILIALLAWIAYTSESPAALFSWPLAGGIGWVASCLVSKRKISVAGLSAVAGSATFAIVDTSVRLHLYLLFYGGPYVIFALLGSLAASVFYEEREDSFYNSA